MDSKPFAQFVRFLTWCSLGGLVLLAAALISGLSFLLSSCAGTQPPRVNQTTSPVSVELSNQKPAASAAKADSGNVGVKVQEPKRRLLGLLPPKKAPENSLEGFPGYSFGKKSTVIIQNAPGNTAAIATKPGTMATGTEATAIDAARAKAPVQGGTGNWQQATDNTKAGQRGGAAATAPGAVATATSAKNGTPFWVYLLVFAGGFATRQVGPWLLRQAIPLLKLKPT